MTLFWIIIGLVIIGLIYKFQKDRKKQLTATESQTPQPRKIRWGWLLIIGVVVILGIIVNSSLNTAREKAKEAIEQEQQITQKEKQITQKEPTKQAGLSDNVAMAVMEITLKNYGLYDIDMKIADGRDKGGVRVLILGYKSTASTPTELAGESGAVLGSYTAGVKNGWDIDELSVVVGDIQGNAVGIWYCSKEWTDDFVAGKISIEELSLKVLTTMTTF